MTLRYRVLGPTRALCPDGSEVPLGGARLRALLAALAAGAGRAVPVPELAARVWGDDDTAPADEAAAVQALVGRLRRALGRDAVRSAPGGYRLAAAPDDVDVFRFERLAREGADALADGDARRAARLLDEALALWQGPVLADLPVRERDPLVVRAERRHAEARRSRLAADTALGRAEHTLPELAALVAAAPLDEPLRALHLRALTAAGRRAEALAAYESARLALDDALGTAPGPELRALHAELLKDAPSTDPVQHAEGAPRPGNLRARLTSFVGREPELLALRADLADARLVTLTGPGGAGKTRLALEAAEAVADAWADGVWLAELAPVREAAQLPQALLTALGARESVLLTAAEAGPRDPLERLVAHCGHRRMLLVLDNCEQIAAGAAELAHELLTGCPGVTVLATSREPLGVPGSGCAEWGPCPWTPPCGCSASAARRPGRTSACPRTRRPPPRSAAASTGCPSPSNSPPPGCGCSPRASSRTASTTGSASSATAPAPAGRCGPGSRPCGPWSTGRGSSWTRASGPCCAASPSSPAASRCPRRRRSAPIPPTRRSTPPTCSACSPPSSTSPWSWRPRTATRCATGCLRPSRSTPPSGSPSRASARRSGCAIWSRTANSPVPARPCCAGPGRPTGCGGSRRSTGTCGPRSAGRSSTVASRTRSVCSSR